MMSQTAGKSITCRAAICWAPKQPLTIETIKVAPPKRGEIRIKIIASGICRSDGHVLDGHDPDLTVKFPMILGHEGSGIVESVGDDVTTLKPGDYVIPLWYQQCRKCNLCLSDFTNKCANYDINHGYVLSDGTSRFSLNDEPVYHWIGTSTFSEYTVCTEAAVAKINPKADLKKTCLIGCCIGTGYGNPINIAKVNSNTTCAIWGLGAIGLAAAMGCRDMGAKRIIGVDTNEEKFGIAKKFGVNEFINPLKLDQPIQEYFQENGGIDKTFECVGFPSTMRAAYESLTPWGTAVIVGLAPKGSEIGINPAMLLSGRTLTGSFYGGYKGRDGAEKLVEMNLKGTLDLDHFITHNLDLEQINEGFELMRKGKSIRTIIHINEP